MITDGRADSPVTTGTGDWRELALCSQVDPELWFPERGQNPRIAKQLCAQCPVRAECLAWALEVDERFGVWGGLSAIERRRLGRRQREADVAVPELDGEAA